MISDQILFFYTIGILFFVVGIETSRKLDDATSTILYMGLSFFTNLIAYYSSYTDTDFTQTAYLPLVLLILSVLFLLWMGFSYIMKALSNKSEDEDEEKEDKED